MATAFPRRVSRPKKILALSPLKVDVAGKLEQSALDEYTRTLHEWARDIGAVQPDPGYDFDTASSAGATTEAVVLTILQFTFADGWAYDIDAGQLTSTTTAGAEAILRVRKATVTGTIWSIGGRVDMPNTGASYQNNLRQTVYRKRGARNLTVDVVLTLQGVGGTVTQVASGDQSRYIRITPIGPAEKHLYGHEIL